MIKMFVEINDTFKISSFFNTSFKYIFLDTQELEMNLLKNKDNKTNSNTLALLYEYMGNDEEALKIWANYKY